MLLPQIYDLKILQLIDRQAVITQQHDILRS